MSEMVERVARGLAPLAWAALGQCDTLAHENRRKASLRHARAAIKAMREPDKAILAAGDNKMAEDKDYVRLPLIWAAMIDEALK